MGMDLDAGRAHPGLMGNRSPCAPAWSLVTALLLLAFGHSGLGVSLRPCCSGVGHCLAPFGPVPQVSHSVRRVSGIPGSHNIYFVVFAACCTLNSSGSAA